MAMPYTIPALVLKRWPAGENALLVRFLTPTEGLLTARVAGAQKPTGSLQLLGNPFTLAEIEVVPTRGMAKVVQASPLGSFSNLLDSLLRMQAASLVVEVAEAASTEGLANPAVFLLALETLQRIDQDGESTLDLPLLRFIWSLLEGMGAAPVLDRCIRSGRTEAGEFVVPLVHDGGFACADVAYSFPPHARIAVDILHLLHSLEAQLGTTDALPDLSRWDAVEQRVALAVLIHFAMVSLGQELKCAQPYLAASPPMMQERPGGDLSEEHTV